MENSITDGIVENRVNSFINRKIIFTHFGDTAFYRSGDVYDMYGYFTMV